MANITWIQLSRAFVSPRTVCTLCCTAGARAPLFCLRRRPRRFNRTATAARGSEGKTKRVLMYKIDSFRKIWERQVLHWKWCPYTIPKRSGRVLFRLGPPHNIRCALIVRHNCLNSFSNNPFCTHLYHIERDAFCDICVRLHAMSTFKKSSRN